MANLTHNHEKLSSESSPKGVLIVFEGIDGTGKSTQVKLLSEKLLQARYDVVMTREPTDGGYGAKLRRMFSDRQQFRPGEELELFIADRKEHVEQVIGPAIAAGKIVVSDRYYFSTAAYQSVLGHDPEDIIRQNELFAPVPDLVLLLTLLSPHVGRQRIMENRRETPNDFEDHDYLEKVAEVFNALERDFITRIDGSNSIAKVHDDVMERVSALLNLKM